MPDDFPFGRTGALASDQSQPIRHWLSRRYVWMGKRLAYMARALRDATRSSGLSLGDRARLALGLSEGILVVTVDRKWADISEAVGVEIILVR